MDKVIRSIDDDDNKFEKFAKVKVEEEKRTKEKKSVTGIIINAPDNVDVADAMLKVKNEKPDDGTITDEKFVTAMKNIGKGIGRRTPSNVVGEHKKTVVEMMEELDKLEREKAKDMPVILEMETDENGKPRFKILMKQSVVEQYEKDKNKKSPNVREINLQESIDLNDIFENSFEEATIYENQNLIKDIAVIGKISKNGREYENKALEQIAELVNGVRVFADHKKEERSVKELIGYLKNARKEGSKVKADLEVLKSQKWIMDIATQMSHTAGFSIVGKGKTIADESGKTKVTEVTKLQSVDFVSFPATTTGLFESEKKTYDENKDPCELYGTEKCIVWNLKEDVGLCKIKKTNCPYR